MTKEIKQEIVKIFTLKLAIWVCILPILMSCVNQPKKEEEKTLNGVQNIPNIVKALEALGNVGKKKVDKDEEK